MRLIQTTQNRIISGVRNVKEKYKYRSSERFVINNNPNKRTPINAGHKNKSGDFWFLIQRAVNEPNKNIGIRYIKRKCQLSTIEGNVIHKKEINNVMIIADICNLTFLFFLMKGYNMYNVNIAGTNHS